MKSSKLIVYIQKGLGIIALILFIVALFLKQNAVEAYQMLRNIGIVCITVSGSLLYFVNRNQNHF